EGALRRVGRVLRLLQALLELAVEELALLPFRLDALAEALLDLGGAPAQLVERPAEVGDRARRRRRLVRDHGPELWVQRELGLTARALDGRTCWSRAHRSSAPGDGQAALWRCAAAALPRGLPRGLDRAGDRRYTRAAPHHSTLEGETSMLRILGILLVSLTLTATASAQLMDKK